MRDGLSAVREGEQAEVLEQLRDDLRRALLQVKKKKSINDKTENGKSNKNKPKNNKTKNKQNNKKN